MYIQRRSALLCRLSDQITTPSSNINFYFMSRFGADGRTRRRREKRRRRPAYCRCRLGFIVPFRAGSWRRLYRRPVVCSASATPVGRPLCPSRLRPRSRPAGTVCRRTNRHRASAGEFPGAERLRAGGPDRHTSFPARRDRTQADDATTAQDTPVIQQNSAAAAV